jgi:Suppressor of fused protein (SUFU)
MPELPKNQDTWRNIWTARSSALEAILGKPDGMVYHAVIPFSLGGEADVVAFPSYRNGIAFVTAELTGEDVGQIQNELGNYELMICAKEKNNWAPRFISKLSRYTCEAELKVGDTMDTPLFKDSKIEAMLFCSPDEPADHFEFMDTTFGLLLCIGITKEELNFARACGSSVLLQTLKDARVFPFTDLRRDSTV